MISGKLFFMAGVILTLFMAWCGGHEFERNIDTMVVIFESLVVGVLLVIIDGLRNRYHNSSKNYGNIAK